MDPLATTNQFQDNKSYITDQLYPPRGFTDALEADNSRDWSAGDLPSLPPEYYKETRLQHDASRMFFTDGSSKDITKDDITFRATGAGVYYQNPFNRSSTLKLVDAQTLLLEKSCVLY